MKRHRSRTATIFQDHALIDRLTVLENVLLGFADTRHPLTLRPWPRESRRRAAEALEFCGDFCILPNRVSPSSAEASAKGSALLARWRDVPPCCLATSPFFG